MPNDIQLEMELSKFSTRTPQQDMEGTDQGESTVCETSDMQQSHDYQLVRDRHKRVIRPTIRFGHTDMNHLLSQ